MAPEALQNQPHPPVQTASYLSPCLTHYSHWDLMPNPQMCSKTSALAVASSVWLFTDQPLSSSALNSSDTSSGKPSLTTFSKDVY